MDLRGKIGISNIQLLFSEELGFVMEVSPDHLGKSNTHPNR